jgi:hypothetical protein
MLLERRQVVRHWFLVPAFLGSNPSAPANFFITGLLIAFGCVFSTEPCV